MNLFHRKVSSFFNARCIRSNHPDPPQNNTLLSLHAPDILPTHKYWSCPQTASCCMHSSTGAFHQSVSGQSAAGADAEADWWAAVKHHSIFNIDTKHYYHSPYLSLFFFIFFLQRFLLQHIQAPLTPLLIR